MREKHPHVGKIILALQDEPAHERAWADGAQGEEYVARSLAKHLDPGVRVLHDRRAPDGRANIDHLAVSASGVWVIDAKRYRGEAEVRKPWFGDARLLIDGRDQSRLADGLARQVAKVQTSLSATHPEVPVHGALCFVETGLPWIGSLTFRGFPLLHPRRLAKRISNATGRLVPEDILAVSHVLATAFPEA